MFVNQFLFFFKTLYNVQKNCVLHVIVKNKELYFWYLDSLLSKRRIIKVLKNSYNVLTCTTRQWANRREPISAITFYHHFKPWLSQTMAYT